MRGIQPFSDDNGRTHARLPGTPTTPEQIAADKNPYYAALEQADNIMLADADIVNVSELEDMLGRMLAQQLVNAAKEASGEGIN